MAPDLADAIGYIDFIPRFRSVGEKCLGDHVESQKRTLRELVGAVRIRAGEEDEDGEICDREDEGGGMLYCIMFESMHFVVYSPFSLLYYL